MTKIKNPLLSLGAIGNVAKTITFLRRRKQNIAEKYPLPKDAKSLAQLSWRHMYQKAVALWHALSDAEKQEWESLARPKHMTGFAWFISQALKPNPGLYLPLQGGTMSGDIDLAKYRLLRLPLPTDSQEAASKAYTDLFTLLTTFNTHEAAITGVHGVGDSIIDSIFARNAAITAHQEDASAHHTKSPRIKVKTETRDMTAATGGIIYTGYGFTPSSLLIFAFLTEDVSSVGISDPAKNAIIFLKTYTGSTGWKGVTTLVSLVTGPTPDRQYCAVTHYSTDGFTLTWVKLGTPAGTAKLIIVAIE